MEAAAAGDDHPLSSGTHAEGLHRQSAAAAGRCHQRQEQVGHAEQGDAHECEQLQDKVRPAATTAHILEEAFISLLLIVITAGCFRYEDEINKRTDAENEFVMLKKVQKAAKQACEL